MAKKHLMFHYNKMLKQYGDLVNSVKTMQEEFEKGNISEDRLSNFAPMVEKMRANMDTLSYAVYLLNLPKYKWQCRKWDKKSKEMLNYFKSQGIDKDSASLEWDNVLENMKKEIAHIEGDK